MTKREELVVFLDRADEMMNCQYIVAGFKLANLLKSIANSETMLALFKNCLAEFDYAVATKKYLVRSPQVVADRGQFIMPTNSRDMLAFIFMVLVDIDSERIEFAEFLNKYFYVDGNCSSAYDSFISSMVKPFVNAVKMLMEKVIEGGLNDPIEAFVQEETRRAREQEQKELSEKRENRLRQKNYGASVNEIRKMLLEDKQKIRNKKISEQEKNDITTVIDMFANVLDCEDKDAIEYAYLAYKYLANSRPITFWGRNKKISKLVKDVINGF